MAEAGKLFLLLCCAVLGWTQPIQWGCYPITSQEGVNISQVVGQWYIVGGLFDSTSNYTDCMGVNITRTNDTNLIFFDLFGVSGDEEITPYLQNAPMIVHSPSLWEFAFGSLFKVVDLPSDNRSLTLVRCNPTSTETAKVYAVILAKAIDVPLTPVVDRLVAAGYRGTTHGNPFNTTGCNEEPL